MQIFLLSTFGNISSPKHTDDAECKTESSQTAISANFAMEKPKFPKCKSFQNINVSYQNMGTQKSKLKLLTILGNDN